MFGQQSTLFPQFLIGFERFLIERRTLPNSSKHFMSSQQLDELEKSLDDKPNRVLRDRINRTDYSNSQSPNRRTHSRKQLQARTSTPGYSSASTATPYTRSALAAQQENIGESFLSHQNEILDDDFGNPEESTKEPQNYENLSSIASYILDLMDRWKIISYSIDGFSYILSCVAITLWGIAQVVSYALRFLTSKKMIAMARYGYLSAYNFIVLKLDQFYKACQPLVEAVRCILGGWTRKCKELYRRYTIQVDWSMIRSQMSIAAKYRSDLLFSAVESAKTLAGRPLVVYRIKSFLITISIIWLAAVIILTKKHSNNFSSVPESDADVVDFLQAKLKELDQELKLKNEALGQMSEEFKNVISLVKSVQLDHEMTKALFEDSLQKIQESIINEVEQRQSSMLDIFSLYGPDYSLSSAGAYVDLEQTSSSFYPKSFLEDVFQITSNSGPEQVLNPSLEPGNCWGLKGRRGAENANCHLNQFHATYMCRI